MERQESKRIHHEMEKFYAKYPQYRVQANHQYFLDAAEQDGGSEVLTAEWMELQLDGLRDQLAVLRELPSQAIDQFMHQNPALDTMANRQLIQQQMKNYGTVEQAVEALAANLSFDQQVADQHQQQQEVEERARLVDILAKSHSIFPQAQDRYRYTTLRRASLDELRLMHHNLELRRKYEAMSPEELKRTAKQESAARAVNVDPVLPQEITASVIRQASSRQVFAWQQRYGNKLLNDRLAGVA
jgi:hypothetical protein